MICNLVLSIVLVAALPVLWKGVSKSFVELLKGLREVARWVKTTTDTIARESVAEMMNHPTHPLPPGNEGLVYWTVRVTSFLVILYGLITMINILSMLG